MKRTSPTAPPALPASAVVTDRFVRYLPLLLFAFALLFRLWGIDWSLPNSAHFFTYHPDEGTVVGASLAVNPLLLRLDPHFYNYGSFSLLMNGFFIHLGEILGIVGGSPQGIPSAGAFLMCRLVTAFLGSGTVIPLYYTGRMLYGGWAGIAAGLLYAFAPLAVLHGHFATVDVSATLWIALSLCFAVRRSTADGSGRDLLLSGLFAGLAAATKYNAGLVIFAAVTAGCLTSQTRREGREILVSLTAAFIAFVSAFPAVLLNLGRVAKAIQEEGLHTASGHALVFANTAPAFVHHAIVTAPFGLTPLGALLVMAGILVAILHRDRFHTVGKGSLVLAAFTLPYYLLIGIAQVKFARYLLPVFPPLLLWASGLAAVEGSNRALRGFVMVAFALTCAGMIVVSSGLNGSMTVADSRDLAAAYLREKGVKAVGFATGPWFYSPTLNPLLGVPVPATAKKAAEQSENPRLIPADGEWNLVQLRRENPDAVVISDLAEYADAARANFSPAREYIDYLKSAYPVRRVFPTAQPFMEIPLGASEVWGLPVHTAPHDMLYTRPFLIVWTKE